MPHPIAEFLTTMGVEVDEEAVKHYGVKGMQWGQRKGPKPNEADAANANDPNADAAAGGGGGAGQLPFPNDPRAQGRRPGRRVFLPLALASMFYRRTPPETRRKIEKFFEDAFVDKKVSRQIGDKGTSREVVVRQGKVNKFLEDMVKKVQGKK